MPPCCWEYYWFPVLIKHLCRNLPFSIETTLQEYRITKKKQPKHEKNKEVMNPKDIGGWWQTSCGMMTNILSDLGWWLLDDYKNRWWFGWMDDQWWFLALTPFLFYVMNIFLFQLLFGDRKLPKSFHFLILFFGTITTP